MTSERETLRIIGSWMEEGRTRLPDQVLDAVLDQIPATPQRRPRWSTRRFADMHPIAKYAIATAAVVVVAIAGLYILGVPGSTGVGGPAASPTPSLGPAQLAPTNGAIAPGRYRWAAPNSAVTFVVPDGTVWTAADGRIGTPESDTGDEFGMYAYLPGSRSAVTQVFSDACNTETKGRPVVIGPTVGDLSTALDDQVGTDVVITPFTLRSTAEPVGSRIAIQLAAGLDRSTCEDGAGGPLKIWNWPDSELGYFALAPGSRGVVYAFDKDGKRFVFAAAFGAPTTKADEQAIDALVESFELSTH